MVLVSASYQLYLDVLGRTLGVDAVLATQLASDERDVHRRAHRRELPWPREVAPARQVVGRVVLGCEGIAGGRRGVVLWAYGDSAGDRELLGAADHPVWATATITSVPSTE